jgi:nicotinate-nucleotide adenylyltransferase
VTPCVALLGGSFDPVHNGHVALGAYFYDLLKPAQLRVIPAGSPWQKGGLHATPEQRARMVQLAFGARALPITLDRQEIERAGPTYTLDTLRQVRAELGPDAAIVWLMGADQLQQLDTWNDWQQLFEYAHIAVAGRPGYALQDSALAPSVAQEMARRRGSLAQIRTTPHGLSYLAHDFAVEVSATQIRALLERGERPDSLVPPQVLDYIEQHHLYKS